MICALSDRGVTFRFGTATEETKEETGCLISNSVADGTPFQ